MLEMDRPASGSPVRVAQDGYPCLADSSRRVVVQVCLPPVPPLPPSSILSGVWLPFLFRPRALHRDRPLAPISAAPVTASDSSTAGGCCPASPHGQRGPRKRLAALQGSGGPRIELSHRATLQSLDAWPQMAAMILIEVFLPNLHLQVSSSWSGMKDRGASVDLSISP